MTKIPLFLRVVSLYVAVFLISFSVFQLSILIDKPVHVALPQPTPTIVKTKPSAPIIAKEIIDGEPISLQVERLGVNLPIKNGVYNESTGGWTLSDDAVVYYAKVTVLPNNQRGSTFLYGHNNNRVIEPLSGLIVGDIAVITTTNGHTFKYAYMNDAVVPPDLTSVLYDDPEIPRLTIMTCEGVWSQARRLMFFDLQEAK